MAKLTKEREAELLASDEILPLGWGLIYRVVCSPAKFTDQEISEDVSAKDPPGTSVNRWEVSSDESAANHPNWSEFSGSTTARAKCPDCECRVHVLMNC